MSKKITLQLALSASSPSQGKELAEGEYEEDGQDDQTYDEQGQDGGNESEQAEDKENSTSDSHAARSS